VGGKYLIQSFSTTSYEQPTIDILIELDAQSRYILSVILQDANDIKSLQA